MQPSDSAADQEVATSAVRMLDPEGRNIDVGLVVALDVSLDDELIAEGRARDVVRIIQNLRKDRGLVVTDRITVMINGGDDLTAAIDTHHAHIATQVLALDVTLTDAELGAPAATATIDGLPISIDLALA